MEHDIPFGNSNLENGTTCLDFPLFLGIFQWDEPTKRVPFTAEPAIPEILTKWKAPVVHHRTTSKMFTLQNFFFYFNSPSMLDFYKVWKVHRTMLLRSDEMVQVMTKYPCSHISQRASLSL